jgi:UDP-N-acetylglucosamine--N-acetylmuramyl-(pentapeptide) pyrophosphoryl-undecaprenol N-acetylglucosamine transferase
LPQFIRAPRIVIAGGGTGGHVQPAIAVIEEIERRGQPVELHWIGSSTGLEREEAASRGIPYYVIETGKFRRYKSLSTIPDSVRVPAGTVQARMILRKLRPDVVFSTGGFVSVPSVVASWRIAPAITHEQTATVGLANQINSRFARMTALSFADAADHCPVSGDRIAVTGNPVRASLASGDRDNAFQRFGFDPEVPLLFVTGGARGSSPLNIRVEAVLSQLLDVTQIIHQTGPEAHSHDFLRLVALRDALTPERQKRYRVVEYVREEMPDIYASASLFLCRSGAGIVTEMAAMGMPSILIPLPGSGGNEQQRNATVLGRIGAALVLDQNDANPERLLAEVQRLLESPDELESMGRQAKQAAVPDAAARMTDLILAFAQETQSTRGR